MGAKLWSKSLVLLYHTWSFAPYDPCMNVVGNTWNVLSIELMGLLSDTKLNLLHRDFDSNLH